MYFLRCLHPPGGAVALTAILGGAGVHSEGYHFVLTPVLLNSLMLALLAIVFNNLVGRRYPHPLAAEERAGESGHVLRLSLDAGRRRIKFYGGGSVPGTDCAKITAYHPLTLPFGLRLPLSLVTERIVSYDTAPARNAAEAAQREGEAQLLHQLQETIGEDGTVVKTEFSREERSGWLYVTLRAECEEQIGTEVPLITE